MNHLAAAPANSIRLTRLILTAVDWANRIPSSILGLIVRIGIAGVFWRSGQTKVSGWSVTDSTIQLFRDEYNLPLLSPDWAANLAAAQEHPCSVLRRASRTRTWCALAQADPTAWSPRHFLATVNTRQRNAQDLARGARSDCGSQAQ